MKCFKYKKNNILALALSLLMVVSTVLVPYNRVVAEELPNDLQRALIPKPLTYEINDGKFTLNEDTVINVKGKTEDETNKLLTTGEFLADKLQTSTGFELSVVKNNDVVDNSIVLMTVDNDELEAEGYSLDVTTDGVKVVANQPAGVFNGVQTVRQLLPAAIEKQTLVSDVAWDMPCSSIVDKPEYDYRGSMLDVSRHFFTADEVKRHIDNLAQYKINKLHLHLTDDQGWRLEIKGSMYNEELSKLKTIGAQTSTSINGIKPGQYTQEEFKDIVEYASIRNIEIIPEFDMPGHSWAALVSLEFLNSTADGKPHSGTYDNTKPYEGTDVGFSTFECRNEKTYEFVEEVIKQVAEISPSKYIHIGGDEAHSTSNEDYTYFINRVSDIAKKYNKIPIGWQDYDKAVTDKAGTVTQFWSTGNKKMNAGVSYILSPADFAYLDMKYDNNCPYGLSWAGLNPIPDTYNWDPTNYGSKDYIVGIEAPLWAETLGTIDAVDYMAFPKMLSHAEIGWTPKVNRSWDEYKQRLTKHGERLANQGINFFKDEDIWQVPYEPLNTTWSMDEGVGTITKDSTGSHDGRIVGGVQWVDGVKGKGLKLDGNGYIDLGIKDLKGNWSAGMWVNRKANTSTNTVLLSGSEGEIKLEQWKNTYKVGITKFGVIDSTFDYSTPEGEWVYLTFVCDDTGTNLYANGEYKGRVSTKIAGPVTRIGANAKSGLDDSGNLFACIDEVSVFNRVLSADEIKDLAKLPDSVNKEELQALYDEYLTLNEADYTVASWQDFKVVMDEVKDILANAQVSQEEVDNAKVALQQAKDALVEKEVVVKDELQATVDKYAEYVEADYTPVTWVAFKDALEEANKVLADANATQQQVNDAKDALETAAGLLEKVVIDENTNKTLLEIAVSVADKITEKDLENVVPAVVREFKAALEEANKVLADANATQEQINHAFDRLSNVMRYLEFFKGDKKDLEAFYNQVKDLEEGKYIASTWPEFKEALSKAESVLGDENAMVDEIEKTHTNLIKAFLNLRLVPNKDALKDLIGEANSLNSANYTNASWNAMQDTLTKAKAVYENPEASQAEVDKAHDLLTKAIAGLVMKPNTPKPGDDTAIKTGDNNNMLELGTMLLLCGVATVLLKRRKDD